MEQLKQTFCLYDMVCDNPKGNGVEVVHMPQFFQEKPEIETALNHVHPFYEIVWFKKGRGVHTVDFTEYPVKDNMLFFIAPGQVHTFDDFQDSEGLVMKVCTHLLGSAGQGDGDLLRYNVFNKHDGMPFRSITPECAIRVQLIVDALEQESVRTGELGHDDYLQSLVRMLLIEIERCQVPEDETVFSTSRASHRTFLAFRHQIEIGYRRMHTVKEYADVLGVSTKTLTNYVAECSEYSPLELINNRIILEAKRMLRYSNMMVKEIAFNLGFEDPSYFVKFFKRLVKVSPAEFRTPE